MAQKETFNIGSRNPFACLDLEDATSDGEETSPKEAPTVKQPLPSEHRTQQRRKPLSSGATTINVTGASDGYNREQDGFEDLKGRPQRGQNWRNFESNRNDDYFSDGEMKGGRRAASDTRGGGGFRFSPTFGRGGPRVGGITRHREYDRHVAGTNRSRGLKKEGGGAHNWGNKDVDFGAEASGELKKGTNDWDVVGPSTDFPEAHSGGGATTNGTEMAEGGEQADTEQTGSNPLGGEEFEDDKAKAAQELEAIGFEEYLQQQAAKRTNLPSLPAKYVVSAAVQRNELEREGYTLHVKEVVPDSKRAIGATAGTSPDVSGRPLRSRDGLNRKYEQEFGGFEMRPRSARGRGGRGGGGGRGGRGDFGGRDERPEMRDIRLDFKDADAFPTLG